MAMTQPIIEGYIATLGYAQIAITSTPIGIAPPDGAELAVINVEGGVVRWRDDGVNPSDTVGMRLLADTYLFYNGPMAAFKAVLVSGTPLINVTFYRRGA